MASPDGPRISLVIPAWNEEAYLPRLLDTVDAARAAYHAGPDDVEVIVADNGSTDQTAEIARRRGCRVVQVEQRCIAAARNGGAQAALGEIVAFADADFQIDRETFNYIDAVINHPAYIGGATGITMERWSLGIRFTWLMLMPALRTFSLDGGVWFCRRDDWRAVGGFNEKIRAGEDVRFLTSLKRLGRTRRPRQKLATGRTARRIGAPRACVINSCRKFDQYGEWHMITQIGATMLRMALGRDSADAFIQRYWYDERR